MRGSAAATDIPGGSRAIQLLYIIIHGNNRWRVEAAEEILEEEINLFHRRVFEVAKVKDSRRRGIIVIGGKLGCPILRYFFFFLSFFQQQYADQR